MESSIPGYVSKFGHLGGRDDTTESNSILPVINLQDQGVHKIREKDTNLAEISYFKSPCRQNFGSNVPRAVTTTITSIATEPVVTNAIIGSVCSTYIICNPPQFACPAQTTKVGQLKTVIQNIIGSLSSTENIVDVMDGSSNRIVEQGTAMAIHPNVNMKSYPTDVAKNHANQVENVKINPAVPISSSNNFPKEKFIDGMAGVDLKESCTGSKNSAHRRSSYGQGITKIAIVVCLYIMPMDPNA